MAKSELGNASHFNSDWHFQRDFEGVLEVSQIMDIKRLQFPHGTHDSWHRVGLIAKDISGDLKPHNTPLKFDDRRRSRFVISM